MSVTIAPRGALVVLLGIFVALATGVSALVPLGEAADELSHYSYVRYVAEHGTAPPVVPDTTVLGETFQPPLAYVLAAPLTAWLPPGDPANLGFSPPVENNPDWELGNPSRARVLLQPSAARWPWRGEALGWHLARFLSVLLGAVTVAATYGLAALAFPRERWVPLLAAALVAFLPTFVGLSAAVTNDALATALGALLLWQAARLTTAKQTHGWGWARAGLLGGLSVWTKASGWLFVGTLVLAAGLRAWQRAAWREALAGLLAAGGAWLVLAGPLWAWNLARSGDVMGQGIQAQVTEGRMSLGWAEGVGLLRGLYRTWWAGFGGAVHLHFPTWIEALLLVPLALAAWGLLRRHLRRDDAAPATRVLVPWLAAHGALVGAAWLLWSSLVMGTGQGRLLFPALPAIGTLLAGGLVAATPARPRVAALGWSAGALALALAAVAIILWPIYRHLPAPPPVPAGATVERWQVGDLPLALVAFHLPWTIDDRPAPGDETSFYVAWESAGPLPDVRLRLRWIDREGASPGAAKEGSPLATPPLTDEWAPGRYAALHRVRLPLDAEAGWHRLMLSVVDPQTNEPLPLHGPGGSSGPEIMVGQTTVDR